MINPKAPQKLIFIFALILVSTVGCNNQRNNRLSASYACDTSVRAEDPTAYSLTERQEDIYTEVNSSEFPDDEALSVISIVSTFEFPQDNEEKTVIRLSNSNVQGNPNSFTVLCALNLPTSAIQERIVNMPVSNTDGEIQIKKFKIEIGNPTREDQSDFIRVTKVVDETPDESSSGDEEDDTIAPPVPFSDYFSSEQDQVTYYKLVDNKESEKSEEELRKINYYIHYKNDADRVRSRIMVTRIITSENK